jgi:hypothetical protein
VASASASASMILVVLVLLLDLKPEWLFFMPEHLVRHRPLALSTLLHLAGACRKAAETGQRVLIVSVMQEHDHGHAH